MGPGVIRSPPKYYCNACGRGFRRRKQHNDHVLLTNRNGQPRCKAMRKGTTTTKKQGRTNQAIILDPEVSEFHEETSVQPMERILDQSYSTPDNPYAQHYYGAPYDYHYPGLATGNRHLRCGLPFKTDPLRRTIVRPVLPKALPSLGPARTLSKHKYGAQAI